MLTIMITGFEADPQRVTTILGIEPTSTARKGEPNKSGYPRQINGWWLDVHPDPINDGETHARAVGIIIETLRGRDEAFKRLREELKPKPITIYGGVFIKPDAQFGLWLDHAEMDVLAACQIGWGVDLFVE